MYMTLRVYRSGWLMLSSSFVIGMELLIHAQTSAVQIWMTCMTFTFWPGNVNDTWHIVPSLAEFVPHMTRIGQIGMEPWSGHCKNFKRPAWLDLLTWKQCMTPHELCLHLISRWPGSGVWCIVLPWVLFVPHMKWIGQIAMEQTLQKLPTTHMTLTICPLT